MRNHLAELFKALVMSSLQNPGAGLLSLFFAGEGAGYLSTFQLTANSHIP